LNSPANSPLHNFQVFRYSDPQVRQSS